MSVYRFFPASVTVAPFGERGLKYLEIAFQIVVAFVAPFGERGLKCIRIDSQILQKKSLPSGSVD